MRDLMFVGGYTRQSPHVPQAAAEGIVAVTWDRQRQSFGVLGVTPGYDNPSWLAFDPKGLVGERTYDCANTLCNPVMPELVHNERRLLTNAAILADMLTLDPWRVLAFTYAYACLNASWWLQLGGSDIVQWHLNVAAIIEPHIEPPTPGLPGGQDGS